MTGAGFVVNNGTVEFQFTKEEYKDALTYLNRLFKEGLLDSQTFTQDTTQMQASVRGDTPLVGLVAGGGFPCDTTVSYTHLVREVPVSSSLAFSIRRFSM